MGVFRSLPDFRWGIFLCCAFFFGLSLPMLGSAGEVPATAWYGDFNGDGQVDIFIAPEEKLLPLALPPFKIIPLRPEFTPIIIWSAGLPGQLIELLPNSNFHYRKLLISTAQAGSEVMYADFNGDGITDLFVQAPLAGMPSIQWFSYHYSSLDVRVLHSIDGTPLSREDAVIVLADRNGDGRADITITPLIGVHAYTALASSSGDWETISIVSTGIDDPMHQHVLFRSAAVAGSADVLNGTAQYSIPLAFAAGSAGVMPEMSLIYSSDATYDYLGMGFSLSGFERLSRCPTDYLRSGEVREVEYTTADRLCLGSNPLVLVSGTHFANGAEYRTEVESYQKIVYRGDNGGWFEIFTRDGLVKRYGFTSNSVMKVGSIKAQWSLDKLADRLGTYYTIEYVDDGTASRPAKILYSMNDQQGITAYADVVFTYADDSYAQAYYRHGDWFDRSGLLTSITNRLDGVVVGAYHFAYSRNPNTGRARIERLYQCGKNNFCALPTRLTWSQGGGSDYESSSHVTLANHKAAIFKGYSYWGDTNRNGYADYCRIEDFYIPGLFPKDPPVRKFHPICSFGDGQNFSESISIDQEWSSKYDLKGSESWLDINGDGYTDFCWFNDHNGKERIRCSLNLKNNTFSAIQIMAEPSKMGFGHLKSRYWVDFDADGRVDICYVRGYNGQKWLGCAFNRTPDGSSSVVFDDFVIIGDVWRTTGFTFTDVNADGLPDICHGKKNELRCLINIGGTSIGDVDVVNRYHWYASPSTVGDSGRRQFVDLNGDGYLDWCRIVKNNENATAYCLLGTGFGWGDEISSPAVRMSGGMSIWTDINDDGRADWCRSYRGDMRCLISNGTGFGRDILISQTDSDDELEVIDDTDDVLEIKEADRDRTFTDLDGDGLMEFCQYRPQGSTITVASCYFSADKDFTDYLLSAENGFGMKTEFEYASMRDPEVYRYEKEKSNGMFDIIGGMVVVKSVKVSGPSGTSSSSEYEYESYGWRPDRFGVIGYASMTITSDNGRRKTKINYSRDIDNLTAGVVTSKETRYFDTDFPAGVVTETVVNDWDVYTLSGVSHSATVGAPDIWDANSATNYRYAVQLGGTTVTRFDLNGTSLGVSAASSTYDGYGNLLTSVSSDIKADQSFTTSTVNQWNNFSSTWVLSRLMSTEVTESAIYNGVSQSDTRKTVWTYYPNGQIATEEIEPDAIGDPLQSKTLTYDALGLIRTVTLAARDAITTTSTSWHDDRYRFIVKERNHLGFEVHHEYDYGLGKRTSSTDANGLSVAWSYDELGRVLTETTVDGTVTHTSYDLCDLDCYGNAVHQLSKTATGAAGAVIAPPATLYFDEFGRQVASRSLSANGTPILTLAEFDEEGREWRSSEPFFAGQQPIWNTINSRDAMGRVLSQTLASGLTQTATFNGLQTVSRSFWDDGQESREYTALADLKGRARAVTDMLGQVMTYEYDAYGNQTAVHQPGNISITQTFDAFGRRTAMSDPDAGNWKYYHDGLGRLLLQENGAGQRVCMKYDALGRLVSRTDDYRSGVNWADAVASAKDGCLDQAASTIWIYDTLAAGKGRLDSVSHEGNYSRHITYDTLGRVTQENIHWQGVQYPFANSFDSNGRLHLASRPGIEAGRAFETENVYNAQYGHLEQIQGLDPNGGAAAVYWQLGDTDARGNVTSQFLQNGLIRLEQHYDPASGQISTIRAKRSYDSGWSIQNMSFTFDAIGSLRERHETLGTLQSQQQITETFDFDGLGRLKTNTVSNALDPSKSYIQTVDYADNGNIDYKSDVGTYTYGHASGIVVCQVNGVTYSPGPHALVGVSGTRNEDYCYDHAGRMIQHGQKTLSYNAFSKTTQIQSADASMAFIYGPERELLQSETTRNNGATHIKKVMLPGYEHSTITENGTITKEEKYYLGSHILITVTNGQDAMNQRKEEFLFHDHIGSLVAVADALGTVTERLSFDPWGRRREWINWLAMKDQDWQTQFQHFTTQKGFTGHEMLDDLGLIHMGGRVYDPTLARFLSTDPVVQQPHNLQNYNRYSYVLNNPVSYTDPTGYFIAGGVEVVATALVGVAASGTTVVVAAATGYYGVREIGRLAAKNKFGPELLQIAVVAGCIAVTAGWGTPACIAAGSGLAAASVAKANGATNHEALRFGLRTAAVAYVSSVMVQGIAASGASIYAQAYGFGVTSAWASAAMGGDPAAGFTSGFISPFVGGSAMLTGLAAGISSKLAGGKFEHGFVVGVTSYMFTRSAEQDGQSQPQTRSQKMLATMDDVVGKIWNLPNTAIGLVYGGLGHAVSYAGYALGMRDVKPNVIWAENNAIQFENNAFAKAGAITIGNTITYGGSRFDLGHDGNTFVQHERPHTVQGQVMGALYLPAHLFFGVGGLIFDGSWHGNFNILERGPQRNPPEPWY